MNEGRFWPWRPRRQAQIGDVSLHPLRADTACKYTAWQMARLCSGPLTSLRQEGLKPLWLAGGPRLSHCHKRHIVYKTERHCNINTNSPWMGDTLGKPSVCGSEASVALTCLLLLLIVCHTVCLLNDLLINYFPMFLLFLFSCSFFMVFLETPSELLVTLPLPIFVCLRDNILQMSFGVLPKRTFSSKGKTSDRKRNRWNDKVGRPPGGKNTPFDL